MENENNQNPPLQNDETNTPEPGPQEADKQEEAKDRGCSLGDGIREVRQYYEDVREKTTKRLQDARSTTLGDLLDTAAVFVKRHPRSSMGIAVALGFFIGRMFRR